MTVNDCQSFTVIIIIIITIIAIIIIIIIIVNYRQIIRDTDTKYIINKERQRDKHITNKNTRNNDTTINTQLSPLSLFC